MGSTKSLVAAGLKDAIDRGDFTEASRIIDEKGIKTADGIYNEVLAARRKRESKLFLSGSKQQTIPNNITTDIGNKITTMSTENKDVKRDLSQTKDAPSVINNINNTQSTSSGVSKPSVDDRPVYQIKKDN